MRFLTKLLICVFLAVGAGAAYLAMRSGDAFYTAFEWVSPARFQQHDALIREVAQRNGVDPMLVKAVIWRESRFDSHKFGSAGERGLMQVTEPAAREWAEQKKVENFRAEDLFDPRVNVEAGTWYLARALERWRAQPNPIPFALAEYNAGASRAQRWAGGNNPGAMSTESFLANIDFPGTRRYIDLVMARHAFYQRRGRM